MSLRALLLVLVVGLKPVSGFADDRLIRLHAPDALVETGLLKFILPRFSLKTQVRVETVDDLGQADVALGNTGRALFDGAGQTWHLDLRNPDHPGVTRFADWLTSDIGQRAITGFAPDGGTPLFAPPSAREQIVASVEMDGDAVVGHRVALEKCTRCHAVDIKTRWSGIGSTPSFSVLRSLPDWEYRFSAFYVLNPHPSFTIVEDVTPPFRADRPSPIVPMTLTLDDVEAILAYVAAMQPADLGSPLVHQ